MEHWFDRATKFLAGGVLPRRGLFEAAALAGVATLMSKASVPSVAAAAPAIMPLPTAVGPCTLRDNGGDTTATFSAQTTYQGKPLTLQAVRTTTGRRNRSATLHLGITYDGENLFELAHSALQARDPAGRRILGFRGTIVYGNAIRGARRVEVIAASGAATGFMDGRLFQAALSTPNVLRFSDTRPQPVVSADSGLVAAVRTLFANASQNVQSCRRVRGGIRLGPSRRVAFLPPTRELTRRTMLVQGGRALMAQNTAPLLAQSYPAGQCADCYNNCDSTATKCSAGAAIGGACTVLAPLCILGALAACESNWESCNNACYQPGGPCCDQQCPAPPNTTEQPCCASDEVCCQDTCCDPSTPVCVNGENYTGGLGFCCPSGQKGCSAASGGFLVLACCPTDTACCGSACCTGDQVCALAAWSLCCPKGQIFCASACCDGVCTQDALGNQVCCPHNLVCGKTCCAPGTRCLKTPSGSSICCNGSLCGDECCGPGARCVNGKCIYGQPCGNTVCGLTNPVCCNGVCCASNQTCVNGRCTTAGCPSGQVPCQYTPNQCCPPNFICCTGDTCCNPSTQVCCGGSLKCQPKGTQCIQ